MKTLLVMCAAACLVMPFHSHAADGERALVGAGTTSCGEYLEVRATARRTGNSAEAFMLTSWAQGFLSGLNYGRNLYLPSLHVNDAIPKFVNIPQHDAMAYELEKFCQDNPRKSLTDSAMNLFVQLVRESLCIGCNKP